MDDSEVLDFLARKCESQAEAARALGITDQQFWVWRNRRGISAAMRPVVWLLANQKGARLPQHWLVRKSPVPKRKKAA